MPACPRCQTPYESGARFCQQCGNPLGEPETALGETPTPPADIPRPAPRWPSPWLWAVLGAGILVLMMAVIFLIRKELLPPAAQAPAPEAGLQEQLARVLGTLREAQVNKDISRFMSCYATAFPGREQKIRETLAAWQDFDFTAMFFSIEDLQTTDNDRARAKVVWDLQLRDRRTEDYLTASQAFWVDFVKEQGAWRIRSLEEIPAF